MPILISLWCCFWYF